MINSTGVGMERSEAIAEIREAGLRTRELTGRL